MNLLGWVSAVLLVAGVAFFFAGTVGLLRFPDAHSRLHAVTKADTLGLGLVVLALVLRAESVAAAGKLVVIWALVLVASTSICQMIAETARVSERAAQEDADGLDAA